MATTTARTVWVSRLVLSVAVAFLLGAALAQGADAKGVKARTSIADRVQTQKDTCEIIGGGTLEVTPSPFQPGRSGGEPVNMITRCKGGTEGGTTCNHTENQTTCRQAVTRAPGDLVPPPGDGAVAEEPTGGGNGAGGRAAPPTGDIAAADERP